MSDTKDKYVCSLSPELQARAKAELNEDPARREQDIEKLREWLIKQPHIDARTDAGFLLRFLRTSKFSIERAKVKIDNFYTMRTAISEWFTNLDVNSKGIQYLLSYGIFLPLGYDHEGRRVALIRSGSYDPSKIKWDEIMRLSGIMNEYLIRDEQSQINGIVYINDMSGMTAAHVVHFTPMMMKKSMALWTDCQPLRIKAMHYWHPPTFFEKLFVIFKMFMKEKLQQRLHFHGSDLKSLHSQIPLEILPTEYGGTLGSTQNIAEKVKKEVEEDRNFFMEDEKRKVDESKRPGKPKTAEDLFGLDGTFRKLEID